MSTESCAMKTSDYSKNITKTDASESTDHIFSRANLSNLRFTGLGGKRENSSKLLLRSKQLSTVAKSEEHTILSPVSELAVNFVATTIGTPTSSKEEINEETVFRTNEEKVLSDCQKDEDEGNTCSSNETISTESSLISNSFTLNSSNRSLQSRHSGESRPRFAQRRLSLLGGTNSYDDHISGSSMYDKSHDMMPIDELSFYSNSNSSSSSNSRPCPSPIMDIGFLPAEGSPQRFTVVHDTVTMVDKNRLLDDEIDSGNFQKFRFTEPQLPKRSEGSPRMMHHDQESLMRQSKSPKNNFRIFNSLSSGSMESMEDDYMELFDMEPLEDESNFPTNLNSLISGHIKTVKTPPEMKRPVVRRCLSLTENNNACRARSMLFEPKTPEILKTIDENPRLIAERCFKRPEPPSISSPIQSKRYKPDLDEKENALINAQQFQIPAARPILRKSISLNDAHIMTALARSSSEPDLIGDFSKPFCLPLTDGRHQDLKSISCETMAKLIQGEFLNSVASFKIIDCRYPYEFDGGHIRGAQNLFTHEQILEELVNCKTEAPMVQSDGPKRHILVFHCEFSSERGPKLSRFLRNNDRQRNTNTYPALHYPEIYLLHGGYKDFFEKFSDLCDPIAYRPMMHPSYSDDYRQCRAKSKSWSGDIKSTASANRLMKSRSRLVL